jgi:outer membrane protein assembly factor BamB
MADDTAAAAHRKGTAMSGSRLARIRRVLASATGVLLAVSSSAAANWPQWGGPDRNFTVESAALADQWPKGGPRELWRRELGDGCSTILAECGVLYTMYRRGEEEFAVALKRKTGEQLWQRGWTEPLKPRAGGGAEEFSPGPYSTPLISGKRLFTIGVGGKMHCLDKKTGNVLWQHDLIREFGGRNRMFGYACSPIAHEKLVIVPVDRPWRGQGDEGHGQALIAFDQKSGEVAWQSEDFRIDAIDYASPIMIDRKGKPQLVFRVWEEMFGFDPTDGRRLWQIGGLLHGETMMTPLAIGKNHLLCSRLTGSDLIKLSGTGDATSPEHRWHCQKFGLYFSNAVRIGDYVVGTAGMEPALLACADLKTGRVLWRKRGFGRANCVAAGKKIILLDENGKLALITVTKEGPTIHSQCKVLDRYAWTAPTLVGTTLYARDRKHIVALDLGEEKKPDPK